MDRKSQVGRWRVIIEVPLHQDRVRTQIHELLARDDAGRDLWHLLVDKRFASRYGNDRGTAFVDGTQSVGDTHAPLQYLFRIVDLAAAGAGEIALEQGFQHQHKRIAPLTAQLSALRCSALHGTSDTEEYPSAAPITPAPARRRDARARRAPTLA